MSHSYSQAGEDMIVRHYLGQFMPIGYVDIGASHPVHYNNTYAFYEQGGHGILVDPLPSACTKLRAQRPRDFVVEAAVGSAPEKLIHVFEPDVLSTAVLKDDYVTNGGRLVGSVKARGFTLAEIMAMARTRANSKQDVRFVSIDCEGDELDVLQSNFWCEYRPTIVCVETKSWGKDQDSRAVAEFMQAQGYKWLADTGLNTFFSVPEMIR